MKFSRSIVLSLSMAGAVSALAPSRTRNRGVALSYSNYPFNTYSLSDAQQLLAPREDTSVEVDDVQPLEVREERRSRLVGGVSAIGVDSYIGTTRTFQPANRRHGSFGTRSLFDEMNQVTASSYEPGNEVVSEPESPEIISSIESSPSKAEEAALDMKNSMQETTTVATSSPPKVEKPVQEMKPKMVVKAATTKSTTVENLPSQGTATTSFPVGTLTPLQKKYAPQEALSVEASIKPKAVVKEETPALTKKASMTAGTLTPLEQKYKSIVDKKPRMRVVATTTKMNEKKKYPARTLTPLEKKYAELQR